MTSEVGSYARHTVVVRMPQIIRQIIEDNDYPPDVVQALKSLEREIASQPIRPLQEPASGLEGWSQESALHRGKTWLEVPWYFAESYFHRRVLEAVRYFQPGPWQGHDPFGKPKRQQIKIAVARLIEMAEQFTGREPEAIFDTLLHASLWGNRADLSRFSADEQASNEVIAGEERHCILIDHTDAVRSLLAGGVRRVDFVNDNVGLDLLFDLALVDFLVVEGWVQEVVFHLKHHPFFVSDAMPQDVQTTISLLREETAPVAQELGHRLHNCLETGQLILKSDPFWTTSLGYRRLPSRLRAEIAHSALVILKGDVNYRRLLGDRHWPHTTPLEKAAGYFPAPFAALRTLKGEIIVGLEPGQAEALYAVDPTWLINGKRGLIQLQPDLAGSGLN